MDKIARSFTITDDWTPLPWSVFEVVPLMDDDGVVLAYAEKKYVRDRVGLPKEIFSHDMKEVRVSDPVEFASFMSRYGLVGQRRSRTPMTSRVMDVKTAEDAREIDEVYGFDRNGEGKWAAEDALRWYRSLQKAAEREGMGWLPSTQSLNNLHQLNMFVTAYEAAQAFQNLLTAAEVTGLLLQWDEPQAVADELGMRVGQMFDYVASWEGYVNELLRCLCPQMELRLRREGKDCPLPLEEYERPDREGSFDQAVALQIYKLSLAKNRYKVCKECHAVFVERETKGRKGRSRSTAKFCSDKCHNRYSQKEKRRRDREARKMAVE